jgi:hypothetical protein
LTSANVTKILRWKIPVIILMVYNVAMPPDSPRPDQQPPYQGGQPNLAEHSAAHPEAYDFIVNPQKPENRSRALPGLPQSNSPAIRAIYFAVGILILLILFVVIKGIIVGPPKLDSFVKIVQDQQELIHITSNMGTGNSTTQQSLSTGNLNLASTIDLSVTSNQSSVMSYLSKNSFKVSTKTLNLGISTSTDTELTNAQTAGTYNQVFDQVIIAELNSYTSDLKNAYSGAGNNGKVLLKKEYAQAELLLTAANSPSNAITN